MLSKRPAVWKSVAPQTVHSCRRIHDAAPANPAMSAITPPLTPLSAEGGNPRHPLREQALLRQAPVVTDEGVSCLHLPGDQGD